MTAPALRAEGLTKAYGDTVALGGVSFEVRPGEALGLLGPNGAGKTSLIRMILDLIRPDSGRLEVLGERPSTALKSRIGYLPEERGLYPKQKVGAILRYLVSLCGVPPGEAQARTEAWLSRVGLSAWQNKRVHALSKGMQQKIQLGAAILHDPDLVVLDEPFTGLDPLNRRLVAEVVAELVDRGAAVLISTHLMDQVQQLCESVVLLRRGEVLLGGPIGEVRAQFAGTTVELGCDDGWRARPEIARLVEGVDSGPTYDTVTLAGGVAPNALLQALVGAGVNVQHFSRTLPSLEEVFVRAVSDAENVSGEAVRAELAADPLEATP